MRTQGSGRKRVSPTLASHDHFRLVDYSAALGIAPADSLDSDDLPGSALDIPVGHGTVDVRIKICPVRIDQVDGKPALCLAGGTEAVIKPGSQFAGETLGGRTPLSTLLDRLRVEAGQRVEGSH